MALSLYCGGEQVERSVLDLVVTPTATDTWAPVGHATFVNMAQDELENAGLRVVGEEHGLTRTAKNFDGTTNATPGGNYFGLFEVAGDAVTFKDHSMIVGLRNSHIKRFGAGFAAGAGVFVCDNLSFWGEFQIGRKHTKNILGDGENDLRALMVDAISKLVIANRVQETHFEEYKSKNLSNGGAEIIMIDALRNGVVTSTQLPKVVEQWDNPDHAEFAANKNGWRLFNAVTESLKGTSPIELPRRTAGLHRLMDRACELPIVGMDVELALAA